MERREDQSVELFRAYSAKEIQDREHAFGFTPFRGEYCSGPLKA